VTKGNAFGSHKYAGKSALRYELGIDILVGNLVWIQGQYSAGKYTDIKIFNKVLRNFLEPGERVEADKGYRGHPDKSESGGESDDAGEGEGTSQDAERLAEELGILSQVFRHHITMHGDVYRACAVRGGVTAHRREVSRYLRSNTVTNSAKIIHSYFINITSLY
jgi:hypothetical protein